MRQHCSISQVQKKRTPAEPRITDALSVDQNRGSRINTGDSVTATESGQRHVNGGAE